MFTSEEVQAARTSAPPETLSLAYMRELIAARPEETFGKRIASASYLDVLAAREAFQLDPIAEGERLMQWAHAREALEAEETPVPRG